MWACTPTSSTPGSNSRAATASAAAPEETENPNLESSWPVRTNSCVCASTPGVTRTRTLGRARRRRRGFEQASEAGDLVEGVHDDAADPMGERVGQLGGRLVVAVQDEAVGGHAGRAARHGARRRTRRRGACLPRGPAGPWRGTGRPWWRRRRPRPRPRRLPGRRGAGGPRRRRRAGCRTPGPAPRGRSRRRGGVPSRPRRRCAAGDAAPGVRSPHRGPSTWTCRIRQLPCTPRSRGSGAAHQDYDRPLPVRRHWHYPAPVAQRIEHRPPEPVAQVRVLPGAPCDTAGGALQDIAGGAFHCT